MEPISPLHSEPSKSRDPAVRRALMLFGFTVACILAGIFTVNSIVAGRIQRIVKNGGMVRSWSEYVGSDASRLLGYKFHRFYEGNYVIRDQYEVYLGDLERGYVGCGTGISFADAPTSDENWHQDPGDEGPKLVRELGRVVKVSFARTSVTDAGLAPLAGMTTIEYLDLSETKVQGPGLANLRGMPLWSLSLAGTPLNDAGMNQLPDFSELRDLYLGETRISGAFVAQLRRFPKLEYLNIEGLPVTDEIVGELISLPLQNLDLSNTEITSASISHLEKMTTLRYVQLCGTKITPDEAKKSSSPALHDWSLMSSFLCPHGKKVLL
jgi:hypothetical protein